MPQPSYPANLRHRQDARFAVQLSKLVVHPSPPRSMLEHTTQRWSGGHVAQTRPERLHPLLEWSRIRVRRGPPGGSMCDISHISCGLEVFWISAVGKAHSDVVVRSNDRPEIAKLLYHLEIHCFPDRLRRIDSQPNSCCFAFESGVRLTHLRCCPADDVDAIPEAKKLERSVEDRATDVVVYPPRLE